MARVVIVVSSRREGNSWYLAKQIKKEFAKDRISCDTITPGNQKIYLCTGCMDCDESGVCDFTDDMKTNIEKVEAAELLIFITPTRWNLLSGDLKIFMDRLNPLYASKKLKDKKAIVVAISGQGKETYSVEGAITSIGNFCESAKMNLIQQYSFCNCLQIEDMKQKEEEISKMIGEMKKVLK